jgi:hypothetical protein
MVFPDIASLMRSIATPKMPVINTSKTSADPEVNGLLRKIDSSIRQIKTKVAVHNHAPIESSAWYEQHMKS